MPTTRRRRGNVWSGQRPARHALFDLSSSLGLAALGASMSSAILSALSDKLLVNVASVFRNIARYFQHRCGW
uniref:DUF2061 domain-containing protein n=1 Tax=Ascaris lumbricoides TaxID=6252 RepID=A0A0M3HNX9_ASCLU